MVSHRNSLAKVLATVFAPEWSLPGVNAVMAMEIAHLAEMLVAEVAGKRLLPCMNPIVHTQGALLSKLLATLRARKWLELRMNPLMLSEVPLQLVELATEPTLVSPTIAMLRHEVILKQVGSGKGPFAVNTITETIN